jgi:hypothetical protein
MVESLRPFSEKFPFRRDYRRRLVRSRLPPDHGTTKRGSVCEVLNGKYYGSTSKTANSFYVGSWGKYTRIRPPRHVDVLFQLPKATYDRFQLRTGNKQSQLLQEIKTGTRCKFPED